MKYGFDEHPLIINIIIIIIVACERNGFFLMSNFFIIRTVIKTARITLCL